jgi:hypothetical protein
LLSGPVADTGNKFTDNKHEEDLFISRTSRSSMIGDRSAPMTSPGSEKKGKCGNAPHTEAFREFPPRQRPGSFSVDQAMEMLSKPQGSR